MILFAQTAAQRPNYKVQYERKKESKKKKTTAWLEKQSYKYNNKQQRNKAQLGSREAKEKIESKKSNYGS